VLLEPAPFEVLYIAQKDYNNPTEIIAIIINADASFDEFYNNLSVVDKLNINVLNKNEFDIFADNYIQICSQTDNTKTSYRIIQDFINSKMLLECSQKLFQ